jgi:SET domain-containing protein
VSLVALRDIPAGDELTIAYVDTDECAEERRAATTDYGFLCACPKCAGVA